MSPPMTDSGVIVHFPHESDMQASMFSDVFAQIESKFSPKNSQTGFHDPGARIAAISTLDEGIDAARQFLCFLLTRRNALMPISLFPPEILARVFHFLVPEERPLSRSRNLGWIRVTHVCRHWRQVALEDSSLWAKIWGIPTNTRCISEMLARAKDSALDIEFDADTKSHSQALLMVLPHLSHTRQLRFHDLPMDYSHIVREFYNWEAPALEHFELKASINSDVVLRDLGENMLFKGHAPRLRVFTLLRVIIPWSLIPRGQLTQLRITGRIEDVLSPGDLNQLVDLLVSCPSLEILALESCLPSQPDDFPHGQIIHLPHLSRLRLGGSASHIMNLLEMFKLPSLTTLHLNLDVVPRIIHSGSEDLSLRIPVILAQLQPVEFKSLIVDTGRNMTVTHSLHITASTFPFTLQNCQARNFEDDIVGNVELVLFIAWLPEPPTYLVQQACKTLPISNLDFISMSATQILDVNWVELFGYCTNVTTMQATGHGTTSLVRALTAPTVTNAESNKSGKKRKHDSDNKERTVVQPASTGAYVHPAIFPNLHSLELTTLKFGENEHDPLGITFDIFKRGLQQRMETSGAPLKLLHMYDCDIGGECADDLDELVEDLYLEHPEEDSIDGQDSDNPDLYHDGCPCASRRVVVVGHRPMILDDWDLDDYSDPYSDEY